MTGWHLGALRAFDLETTAPDPNHARIVTACTAAISGTGGSTPTITTWLVNPGTPIPPAATEIHGITDEHAQTNGTDPTQATLQIAAALETAWDTGTPVIGHNIAYDLTVLTNDLQRHGHPALDITGPVIDTLVLDKHVDTYRKGKRTLTAACQAYNVRLDGAHDATFDALASARIAWRICQRYPEIAAMSLADLHAAQAEWAAEQAASLQAHFRKTDPTAVVDGTWPVRQPAAPQQAAA